MLYLEEQAPEPSTTNPPGPEEEPPGDDPPPTPVPPIPFSWPENQTEDVDQLLAQNPRLAEGFPLGERRTMARTILKRCYSMLARAARSASQCFTLPVFVSEDIDVPQPTKHDRDAMKPTYVDSFGKRGYPGWVYLTYDNTKPDSARGWYAGLRQCDGNSVAEHCDEYPFFRTQQGGGNASPRPSLRVLDRTQNARQGGKLNRFYANCGLTNRPGRPFLSVPAPAGSRIPTQTRLCNGHTPSP